MDNNDIVISLDRLSEHTTLKVGGLAYMAFPKNIGELKFLLGYNDCVILGAGSNVLAADGFLDGKLVIITRRLDKIEVMGERIYAECGARLSDISRTAEANSLGGAEFLLSIPGTMGGAVVMNAGVKDDCTANIIEKVAILGDKREEIILSAADCGFSYRKSNLSGIVTGATFCLKKTSPLVIAEKKARLLAQRKNQPYYRTCGSVFVNPEGDFAARLIEQAKLKGFRIGKAVISQRHANFIETEEGATARDVYELIAYIKRTVYRLYGVSLLEEVKYLGEF